MCHISRFSTTTDGNCYTWQHQNKYNIISDCPIDNQMYRSMTGWVGDFLVRITATRTSFDPNLSTDSIDCGDLPLAVDVTVRVFVTYDVTVTFRRLHWRLTFTMSSFLWLFCRVSQYNPDPHLGTYFRSAVKVEWLSLLRFICVTFWSLSFSRCLWDCDGACAIAVSSSRGPTTVNPIQEAINCAAGKWWHWICRRNRRPVYDRMMCLVLSVAHSVPLRSPHVYFTSHSWQRFIALQHVRHI